MAPYSQGAVRSSIADGHDEGTLRRKVRRADFLWSQRFVVIVLCGICFCHHNLRVVM